MPSPRRSSGFTLMEMLAALGVLALAATLVTAQLRRPGEQAQLDQAADVLMRDVQRAQTEARRSGEPVALLLTDDGYRIDRLDLARAWPDGIAVQGRVRLASGWQQTGRFVLAGRPLAHEEARIDLALGDELSRTVRVEPITGQVHVER
jgi:general secretion pathway protein H